MLGLIKLLAICFNYKQKNLHLNKKSNTFLLLLYYFWGVVVKTTSIKIDEKLENEITYLSKEKGISKSMLIREALIEYVANNKTNSKGSFSALAKDLSGSLEGAKDLSTNPKHLAGFGS